MLIWIRSSSFCEKICINKANNKPGTNVILDIDFFRYCRDHFSFEIFTNTFWDPPVHHNQLLKVSKNLLATLKNSSLLHYQCYLERNVKRLWERWFLSHGNVFRKDDFFNRNTFGKDDFFLGNVFGKYLLLFPWFVANFKFPKTS